MLVTLGTLRVKKPKKKIPRKFNLLFVITRTLYSSVQSRLLEIRLRNEQAINSTQNRIYSTKVFYVLPTLATLSILQDIYFIFVSELI